MSDEKSFTGVSDVELKGLEAVRTQALRCVVRIARFQDSIDRAFCGQPFILSLPPTAPANRQRFRALMDYHKKAMKLMRQAIEICIIAHGLTPGDNWAIPLIIEDMRLKAQGSSKDPA